MRVRLPTTEWKIVTSFAVTGALQPALNLVLLPVFAALLGPEQMGIIAYVDGVIFFVNTIVVVFRVLPFFFSILKIIGVILVF